jgi:hypothetical protein
LLFDGNFSYRLAYASGIDMLGISLAKNVMGISVGSEISYRWDMPLASQALVGIGPTPPPTPGRGDTTGARGETMHAVVNFLGCCRRRWCSIRLLPRRVRYSRWNSISQGKEYFLGRDGYDGLDWSRETPDGAINCAGMEQALPGVDLACRSPSPVRSASPSLPAAPKNGRTAPDSPDVFAKYKADLTYVGYFGNYRTDGGQIPPPGLGTPGTRSGAGDIFGLLKDRDTISLTLKATF